MNTRIRVCRSLWAAAWVVLGAGCADMRWHKPGANPAALDEDLVLCRQEARLRAGRETVPGLVTPPAIRADPPGQPLVVQSHHRESERLLNEQDLMRTCMRDKGYELVRTDRR